MPKQSAPNSSNRFHASTLLIVGHGSTVNPDSSEPTLDHAATIRRKGIFGEVACCFWKEQPSMRDALHMLEGNEIFVVPNFISEGYFTESVIPRELGLAGSITNRGNQILHYCEPVGNHPKMTDSLLARAAEVAPDVAPADASLLIVGHGTGLNDNSAKAAKAQVAKIREMGVYHQVEAAYMEEPPLIAEWDQITTSKTVVVVPFFISDGLHSYQDIPVLLGVRNEIGPAASQAEVFSQNPYTLRGKTLYYASAIGTDPSMAEVIVEQAILSANNVDISKPQA